MPTRELLVGGVLLICGCHAIVGIEERGAGGDDGGTKSKSATDATGTTGGSTSTGAPSLYEQAVKASNPILYYRFEEDGGDVIDTASGRNGKAYSFDGTSSTEGGDRVTRGVASPLPALSKAIRFAGAADTLSGGYVRLTDAATLAFEGNQPFSIELWAAMDVSVGTTVLPISHAHVGVFHIGDGYWLHVTEQGGQETLSGVRAWPGGLDRVLSSPYDASTMHHYVFVYDGTAETLYIDGVENGACSPLCTNQATVAAAQRVLAIGGGWNGADTDPYNEGFVNGLIDEVAIYAHALGYAEVLAHHTIATQLQ